MLQLKSGSSGYQENSGDQRVKEDHFIFYARHIKYCI